MTIEESAQRPAYWEPFVTAAKEERLVLQVCNDCQSIKYPPAEICAECLGEALEWQDVDGTGKVLALTEVLATPDDFYRELIPVAMGTVKLASGPVVFALFPDASLESGVEVRVVAVTDVRGTPLLLAHNQGVDIASEDFEWKDSTLQKLFKAQ